MKLSSTLKEVSPRLAVPQMPRITASRSAALALFLATACGDSTGDTQNSGQHTGVNLTPTQGQTGATGTSSGTDSMGSSSTFEVPTSTSDGLTDGAGSTTSNAETDATSAGVTTTTGMEGYCGNGIKEDGEECDDGNFNDKDECTQECVFPPSPCATQHAESTLKQRPVDIIVAIDNSGSMSEEIKNVQDNINTNFANILEDEGLDYRVILIAEHGKYFVNQSVCIESPLSGIPMGGCAMPPLKPVNTDEFFHHNWPVESTDMWHVLPNQYDKNDKTGGPGWKQGLRKGAFTNIVGITDDNISGKKAVDFNNEFIALEPERFGGIGYKYFSIVGLPLKGGQPYLPDELVVNNKCIDAVNPGQVHQELSKLTGGAGYSICEQDYGPVFEDIAESIVTGTPVACEFEVPTPPDNQTINLSTVALFYNQGGLPIPFEQVPSKDDCIQGYYFYIENDQIILCSEACDDVQEDMTAKIDIEYSCIPLPG